MKCIFCSKPQDPGKGVILAMNDGRVLYFCSSKCKKNYKMGRNPKKTKWVRPAEKVKTREKSDFSGRRKSEGFSSEKEEKK